MSQERPIRGVPFGMLDLCVCPFGEIDSLESTRFLNKLNRVLERPGRWIAKLSGRAPGAERLPEIFLCHTAIGCLSYGEFQSTCERNM